MAKCLNSDAQDFADTNCMFFTRPAFDLAASWYRIPPYAHCICDRVLWSWVKKSGRPIAHTQQFTVGYHLTYPKVYEALELPVSPEAQAKGNAIDIALALRRWEEETGDNLQFSLKMVKMVEKPSPKPSPDHS